MWKIQVKEGDIPFEPFDAIKDADEMEYEISVIRSSNSHGQRSWGWEGDEKIIFNVPEYSKEFALKCANILCEGLNEENNI